MTTSFDVSVIVPAFNAASYLPEAIESALNQSFLPREIIVVDDGSTDNTAELLDSYGDKIRYIHQENQGPAVARNRGIAEAKGRLIAFLDADDVWLPEKLQKQVEFLARNHTTGLVHTDYCFLHMETSNWSPSPHGSKEFSGWCYPRFFDGNGVFMSTALVRRECLDAVGLFDEQIRSPTVEDYDLWFRIARHFEFGFVAEPLALYRRHQANFSQHALPMMEGDLYVLLKALRADPCLAHLVGRRTVRERLFPLCFSIGYLNHDACRPITARAYFRRALRHRPTDAYTWGLYLANLLPSSLIRRLRSMKSAMAGVSLWKRPLCA